MMASVIQISYKDLVIKMPKKKSVDCNEVVNSPSAVLQTTPKDLATKNLDGMFKCFRCVFACKTTTELAAHNQIHRRKDPFKCFECDYNGKNREDFVQHSLSHNDNNYFKCSKCEFKAKTSSEIRAHVQKGHTEDVLNCPLCGKMVSNKYNISIHLDWCKGKTDSVKGHLELHKEAKQDYKLQPEEPTFFTCTVCYFIFNTKTKLADHMQSKHYKKVNKALEGQKLEKCKKITKRKTNNIGATTTTTHKQSKVKIDEAVLTKPVTISPLSSHISPKVSIEKIYLCDVCHSVFTSKSDLNQHTNTHKSTTDSPEDKKQVVTYNNLKKHNVLQRTKKKSFLCSICDKNFTSANQLSLHKKEHIKGRTYKCPYCPRVAKTESGLQVHVGAHSRMKSLCCSLCTFTAGNPSLLKKHHIKKHSATNNFECQNCNAKYKYKYSLIRHSVRCLKSKVADEDVEVPSEAEIRNENVEVPSEMKDNEYVEVPPEIEMDNEDIEDTPEIEMDNEYIEDTPEIEIDNEDMEVTPEIEIDNEDMEVTPEIEIDTSQKEEQTTFPDEASFTETSVCSKNKTFLCKKCGIQCTNASTFRNHMKTHSSEACVCPICGIKFANGIALNKHKLTHSDEKPFQCTICLLNFKRRDSFLRHCKMHSITEPYKCPHCNFTTKRKDGLLKHISTHERKKALNNAPKDCLMENSKGKDFLCSLCDMDFSSETLLTSHKKEHLNQRIYKCPICSRVAKTESSLQLHVEGHSKSKSGSATDNTALTSSLIKKNPLSKNSQGNYECQNCSLKFQHKLLLLRHYLRCVKTNKEEEDYVGDPRSETEMDISLKEKLTCSECKATFTDVPNLERHLQIHFQKKPYRCMKCGLRCSNRGAFKNHLKTHSLKSYVCPICDKEFTQRVAMYQHKICHSEEKPYQCPYCLRCFKRKSHWKRHTLTHSDIKLHQCPHCSFTAKRKDSIGYHIRATHQKEKLPAE